MENVRIKKVTSVHGMPVYTDEGVYYGDVEESMLQGNKVVAWKVKATKASQLSRVLGGARGVMVPHQMVKNVGDIMIISKSAIPQHDESMAVEEEEY